MSNTRFERLVAKLRELFQLDQPELDFGIYRILHARSEEITAFLENELLPQVKDALAAHQPADKVALQTELAELEESVRRAGLNPDQSPKVKELRERLESEAVDLGALEADVYDHLYRFFSRYYHEGDFISLRRYKEGVYAIPYEGEEVKLYWANHDQYYVKTTEYLRDYAFRLRPDDAEDPMRVRFRLVDAAEGEHGNVKEAEGKKRVFVLAADDFIAEEPGEDGKQELVLRFEYRPATVADWPETVREVKDKPPAQKDLLDAAVERVLAVDDPSLARWISALGEKHTKADGSRADYSRLRAHLDRYTARNTFDYFIHKDLGGFLRRELDFYIKSEVMRLDDIDDETAPRVEQYLSKIKVIRRIALKIIDFLAQLEDFQKKLWLKKKFVTETSWCVSIATILGIEDQEVRNELLAAIAANDAQRREWVQLHVIDAPEADLERPAYSEPLTVEFVTAHPTLMIDTRHFEEAFVERLLAVVGDLDELTDGVLFHSENFQALSLMQARYRGQVKCIYIDPPYNTGDSEILYKNGYLFSSWLSLMDNRLQRAMSLLQEDSCLFIAIDDLEMPDLSELIDTHYRPLRREMIVVNHHPQGGKAKTLANTHEYMLACVTATSDRTLVGRQVDEDVELRPFKRSGTAESNFRRARPKSFYAIIVDTVACKVVGIERPPAIGDIYPTGPAADGHMRVYPIGAQGEERVWRRSYESCLALIANDELVCSAGGTVYHRIEAGERKAALFSNWIGPRYNAGTNGANLLADIIGEHNPFAYPKSIHTVGDALWSVDDDRQTVVDFFGGSGTTGHAIINLNREDAGLRKFVLVEMGEQFETVLFPRLKKVAFSPEWKNGRPKRLATPEEAERSPRIFKVVRLESYEDALNNLELKRSESQQSLLDTPAASGADGLKEQYLLGYMLDVESRGGASLLNVGLFTDPRVYTLRVKQPGSDETREVTVDLLETFNWLLGLRVHHIATQQSFSATFKRDDESRLKLEGRLKLDAGGGWWFRTVQGEAPDGRKVLVIWRNRPGGDDAEGIEQDNLVLDEWFTRQGYSAKDSEFDLIYVNGDNNLENLKDIDDRWKVRLIEEEFFRLMFDVEDV